MRLLALPLLAVLAGALGWGVSDRLEQNNDFCNACHLPGGTPLHQQVREDFDRVIPVSLAGVHGRGWLEERESSAFRCIDCHSGAGVLERTRVKLLAARDGVRYALGSFEEPEGMPFDLSKAVCLECHPSFRGSAAPGWTLRSFHGHPEHDGDASPVCVSCHSVHTRDGNAMAYQMARDTVDRQCRSC
ncbi:MAG: cytochrome c3 family protein, partial [Myxococcales bacterium]|nr:cytochrome c3 family protein [Myxococcales bacterium]